MSIFKDCLRLSWIQIKHVYIKLLRAKNVDIHITAGENCPITKCPDQIIECYASNLRSSNGNLWSACLSVDIRFLSLPASTVHQRVLHSWLHTRISLFTIPHTLNRRCFCYSGLINTDTSDLIVNKSPSQISPVIYRTTHRSWVSEHYTGVCLFLQYLIHRHTGRTPSVMFCGATGCLMQFHLL